ncbi:MAG: hypothetical protein LBS12_04385 [Prevotellaceae bacterium]|nr:hypothetical protein [Prevotellaceae bacterium]
MQTIQTDIRRLRRYRRDRAADCGTGRMGTGRPAGRGEHTGGIDSNICEDPAIVVETN